MNVIGCRPDGWWRDRRAAMGALVERLEQWAVRENPDVTVLFERPPTPPIASSAITVTHAPAPAPNSADDEIVALLAADPHPEQVRVATSDRGLAERVRRARGEVFPAERLRDLIDHLLRGGAGRTLFDHQMQVTLGRFSQSAEQQFAKIGRCGAVTVEQGDAPVGAACQCARGRIGNIAQRLHRARHGLPRAGTDQRLAVYGARCGHDRYAGTGGDILDRGRLAVVSLHRDRSLAILQAKENRP